MIDADMFNKFIGKANLAHQQLCVWFSANNEFAKHQARWNELDPDIDLFATENFTRRHRCKYKNFWGLTVATIQHGWIMSTTRLFDPAFHRSDKRMKRPRISFDYILLELQDSALAKELRGELEVHGPVIKSLKKHRDNFLAHNDAEFRQTRIEAGVENLFQWLEDIIQKIKISESHLSRCGIINIEYNEKLSQCGIDEVFEALLAAEKYSSPKVS